MKTRLPLLSPARLARAVLAGLIASGVGASGLALAAGWTGPPSPAPFNNVPELIWNAQESGFVPQDASFRITGSGVLGTFLQADQIAAGGYEPDGTGIAITAPSIWGTDVGAGNATVFGDLVIDPAAGAITLGGVRLTAWPAVSEGDITGIAAGSNLVGGGDSGEISLDLSSTPTVDTLTVNVGTLIPSIGFTTTQDARIRWNSTFNRLDFTSTPFFAQGLTTQANSISTFSGPVNVTGGNGFVTAQAGMRSPNICTFGGLICNDPIYLGSNKISTGEICLGTDCRTSWPAGGGGGGGTVTSVASGTGLTGGPITGAGTLSLDTAYTDDRYANAAGDVLLGGDFRVTGGSLQVTGSAGFAVTGRNTGSGFGVEGVGGTGIGVKGESTSNSGVSGESSSGVALRGVSTSNYGLLAQGSSGGRFLNSAGSVTTDIATAADGVNTNRKIVAPEYCIGASCITSWPSSGGGGTVTSVASGTGLTGGPITGAGTLSLDTVYTDGRYVDISGDTMTGALTVSAAAGVTSPQYCIGGSCVTSWPAGTVTSVSQGTGIVATPNPISGAGTIAFDQTYGDSRYVNNIGPDQVVGEFDVTATTGFPAFEATNNGSGEAIDAQSGASDPTIDSYNTSATGLAGNFRNGSGLYTYLAWGGTYGLYTTGRVRAGSLEVGGVSDIGDWTTVTVDSVAIAANWNNAPTACPAGYKVTGISCFNWDAGRNYPGCTSKRVAATPDNTIQLYGTGFNVSYTLFCVKLY